MGNVISLDIQTTVDLPPDQVLGKAIEAGLSQVIVIGVGPDGPYHASSIADTPEILFRMEMFKRFLLERAARGDA